jgi:ElaB/YqjD/DUF883 family membrane-anchored ribosome-binding protein
MARTMTDGNVTDPSVSDLTADIATLRKDLANLTSTIGNLTKAKAADLADTAEGYVASARDKGHDAIDHAAARARDAQSQAEAFVKAQPATALGIAAGIGFLVGMLSTRK